MENKIQELINNDFLNAFQWKDIELVKNWLEHDINLADNIDWVTFHGEMIKNNPCCRIILSKTSKLIKFVSLDCVDQLIRKGNICGYEIIKHKPDMILKLTDNARLQVIQRFAKDIPEYNIEFSTIIMNNIIESGSESKKRKRDENEDQEINPKSR